MNLSPIAITLTLGSALVIYLLFSGKWDKAVDIVTGHQGTAPSKSPDRQGIGGGKPNGPVKQ